MKVLVVDDDIDLLDLMTYALRREGYNVLAAVDGQQALQRWESENPDIVLLDGNLPKIDGFEVCRRIRHESKTPIIMRTARDEEEDILRGLQIGADDYMTKPFSAKQLAARMKAVMRRCQSDPYRQPASQVSVGDLVLDIQSHEVTKAGEPVQLTRLEFRILYMLALNEDQTHIEFINLDTHPELGTMQAAVGIQIRSAEPGNFIDWHPAPRRQFVI